MADNVEIVAVSIFKSNEKYFKGVEITKANGRQLVYTIEEHNFESEEGRIR